VTRAWHPTAVVITKASRANTTLPATLDALHAADLDPILIHTSTYNGPTPDAEVRRLGLKACQDAAPAGRGLLFFEDDIAVTPTLLKHHIALAVEHDALTAFCAVNRSHYRPSVLDDPNPVTVRLEPMPAWDAPLGRGGGFHGSMALYIPPVIVDFAVSLPGSFIRSRDVLLDEPVIPPDHQHRRVTGFDMWLKWAASRVGPRTILNALPNSVDHVGDGEGERWRSPTFGRPWRFA